MFKIFWIILILENIPMETAGDNSKEIEYRSYKFSIGFHLLLPAVGLGVLILGRRHICDKLLLQLDSKYLTVLCPCFIKRENIVKWACNRLPRTWSSNTVETLSGGVKELWNDGSLLCTLINSARPGACPNPHRHWKQPPSHAQALAYKYFGVTPVFSNEELNRNINSSLERKFIGYLSDVQQSINKISEISEENSRFSSQYIVRGMGLFSGEQHKKTTFYIYLNDRCDNDDTKEDNIIIHVKGPFGTYGEAVAPKLVNKRRKLKRKTKQERRSSIQFIENLMQSNAWNFTRAQRKNINEGVEIETAMENDRIRVSYVPTNYGMYEISMISGGELLKGCPFNVHIFINELNDVNQSDKVVSKARKVIKTHLPRLPENDEAKLKPEGKSRFNFREVVEEITKNGSVYRSILGHTPEVEMSSLEISASINKESKDSKNTHRDETDYFDSIEKVETNSKYGDKLSENEALSQEKSETNNIKLPENSPVDNNNITKLSTSALNIKNAPAKPIDLGQTDENKAISKDDLNNYNNLRTNENNQKKDEIYDSNNLRRPSSDKNIIINEFSNKQNSKKASLELTSSAYVQSEPEEKLSNASLKVQIINNYSSSKNQQTVANKDDNNQHTKANNLTTATFANKNLINSGIETKHSSYVFEPKYINKPKINKIKIPELFAEDAIKKRPYHWDDKYFKNILNESNKDYSSLDYEKKISAEFEKKRSKFTSPTCPGHIVTEVDAIQKTVAEKRKIFAQRTPRKLYSYGSNSLISSFSDENEQKSTAELNVLNEIHAYENYSLTNTISLPNLSLETDCSLVSFESRKSFWESMSTGSSTSVSTKSLSPRKPENSLNSLERSKLIWKKPQDIYKSADDVLSLTSTKEHKIMYNSVEDSLDKCAVMSVEERKRKLLERKFEEEKFISRKVVSKVNYNEGTVFVTPITEKIQRYKSALELSSFEETKETQSSKPKNQDTKSSSQFKNAINYFKNLETQSRAAERPAIQKSRRRTGGSLNLPKVSQKFFIDNLYRDVFGNEKSHFKGTPNKSALVEALATFSRTPTPYRRDDEDDIQYEIFKSFVNKRKRKSLKALFDIHY
ncbi:unnamed protein product [Phyllotreta striolata]|uniref:Uncharacterized protein n=1 Tax=Phyllotreta striolata TaxID=444603 RepID=A0A9N9TUH0_PHYSR|nr:unnamed protein product [Phyllotreta striolata]